jgi:hypothetical protein
VATEYKRNPTTGELIECDTPDTVNPPPTGTDKGVAIIDPISGNPAEVTDDGEIKTYNEDSNPIRDLLEALLQEQKLTNLYLSEIRGDTLEI